MENVFVSQHPLVKHKLTALRDVQTPPRDFRDLVRELSMLLCYEATQDLPGIVRSVQTPLATAEGYRCADVGVVPILRAGLGMLEGVMAMLPSVQVWHIGMRRDEETLQPITYYNRLPSQSHMNFCIVLDPMLATGGTAVAAVTLLKNAGITRIKYMGLIAAPEGVEALHSAHPDVKIHVGAVDSHLNERGFIVPGLGDAGDRQFGT
ncbi:MAG: uracil phosphoribosyltransferase [Chloroflexi bacterium]|nr:uracil phosphoribosyltransferase [Chloroflexota bacterium]